MQAVTTDEINEFLKRRDLETLSSYDQLQSEKLKGNIFLDFNEGKLNFPPTFKYCKGTNTYVYLSKAAGSKRDPAWCDRVLYRGEVELIAYNACTEVMQSDHKPVYAEFNLNVSVTQAKHCNRTKLQEIMGLIQAEVDTIHQHSLPKLALNQSSIEFQNVRYREKQSARLILSNTGGSILTFKFKWEQGERGWLSVSEAKGAIFPGESHTVSFSVLIREQEARKAYQDPAYLEASILISYIGGPDNSLEIKCHYQQTSFGASISDLVKLETPVALLTEPIRIVAANSGVEHAVPKELWSLLKFLYVHGLHTPNLFVQSGDPAEIILIRQALDFGGTLDVDTDVHSVSSVLIEWLSALNDPMVPVEILDAHCKMYVKHSKTDPTIAQQFLAALPPANSRSLLFLASFLREIALQSDDYLMLAAKLAMLFSFALTQSGGNYENFSTEDLKKEHLLQFHRQGFLLLFLLN